MWRNVDPATDGFLNDRSAIECLRDELPLRLSEVTDRFGQTEHVSIKAQVDWRFVVCGRDQDASGRIDLETDDGRRVEVRKENQRFILLVMPLQVIGETRRPRPL